MNRDDVIRMAREAGLSWDMWRGGYFVDKHKSGEQVLIQFAALVAVEERRKHQADIEHWKAQAAQAEKWRALALCKEPMQPGKVVQEIQREAMELEREACAQVVDAKEKSIYLWTNTTYLIECAAAIRARGNQ
jgi:hypothetical protein